jgi:polyhydroxybutyrate depolymerase
MSRKAFIAVIAGVLSVPLVLSAIEGASFYVHNRNNGSIISSGEKREYLLYVPRSYDRSRPTPLVISMHGAGGWPVQQQELTRWNDLADREGFIVVYPSGLGGAGPRVWRTGDAKDPRFISELIDKIEASYNIDAKRIYANGFSNGGGMTFVLSCTMPDRIAAAGMVGAAQTLPWSWCTERRAVPMIAFHGTADRFAYYDGGQSWVAPEPFPSVPVWTTNWAHRNHCDPRPVESQVASDVSRREYVHCAGDAAVVLYTIRGGGHTWPGGEKLPEWFAGPTSRGVDATREMWAFFREHPLADPPSEKIGDVHEVPHRRDRLR